jgi:hypothetical protein
MGLLDKLLNGDSNISFDGGDPTGIPNSIRQNIQSY